MIRVDKLYFAPILIACLTITACHRTAPPSGHRVVSLSPAMTEIIFALDAEDLLVGTTTFCDYPEAARAKTRVGDFSNPSLERIVALKPTLVIVNPPEQNRTMNELRKLEINLFVSAPSSLDSLYQDIKSLGDIVGKKGEADSLVNYMQTSLVALPGGGRRVYVEISSRPLVTIGKASFLNELLTRAGATNVFADIDDAYPIVNQEAVIKKDPQIIIVLHPGTVADRTGWQHVDAVKNRRLYYDIAPELLLRPGPRLVAGFEKLCRILND